MGGSGSGARAELARQSIEQAVTVTLVLGIVVAALTTVGWLAWARATSLVLLP